MRLANILMAVLLSIPTGTLTVRAQSQTVFRGVPVSKVSTDRAKSTLETIPSGSEGNLQVVVSRIGERYYWASRENTELVRVDAGAFINYIATNGSGYIKIVRPNMKAAASLMSDTEARHDYSEHLTIGLRTITYYGATREIVP